MFCIKVNNPYDTYFIKGKNYHYNTYCIDSIGDTIIKGADAITFKHIEGTQDGRDKNHCYNYGTRIDCKFIQKRNGL